MQTNSKAKSTPFVPFQLQTVTVFLVSVSLKRDELHNHFHHYWCCRSLFRVICQGLCGRKFLHPGFTLSSIILCIVYIVKRTFIQQSERIYIYATRQRFYAHFENVINRIRAKLYYLLKLSERSNLAVELTPFRAQFPFHAESFDDACIRFYLDDDAIWQIDVHHLYQRWK